jgi:hypothetical protein
MTGREPRLGGACRRGVLLSGAAFVILAGSPVEAKATHAGCVDGGPGAGGPEAAQLWTAPLSPAVGRPLRMVVVSEIPEDSRDATAFDLVDPSGKRLALVPVRRGGPPWSAEASAVPAVAGTYAVEWSRKGKVVACRTVVIARRAAAPPASRTRLGASGAWVTTAAWDRATENLFSAWVASLFDAPPAQSLGFRPLAQALRDPARNFLHDHRGLGEDDPRAKTALIAAPDCADLPYFLRAYFSWKLGLPFGMHDCDRGTESRPPRCTEWITNESPLAGDPREALGAMKKFLRLLANKVHSGSARTALGDDRTDTYPVKLSRAALRPGTVFADPYGHVLMLVGWVDQTADSGGILLAVDGQPDNSIGRKRFWEGTFLYANDVVGAGPGFKAFRPLLRGADGKLMALPNQALRADARFAPFSMEQAELGREAFYARMGTLINPRGLEPQAAYRETMDALVEQLTTRVGSVDNGEKFMRDSHNGVVAMPEGAKIFETVGPWEDYATPSRDMRLLIAIQVLETLPNRIVEHPELFRTGGRDPGAARAEIEKLHASSIHTRSISYTRSDGASQVVTVGQLLGRKVGLEMAYNPNDCVETRWAAPLGSAEAASCQRHAPAEQRARMEQVRPWFHDMRRPAR